MELFRNSVCKSLNFLNSLRLHPKALGFLFLVTLIVTAVVPSKAVENKLLIGEQASTASLEIPIQKPIDLNFRSKSEILELRRRYVARTPNLVAHPYEPSAEVFGAIEDNKPWWGLAGQGIWGPGQNSSLGESEESRFIANPFFGQAQTRQSQKFGLQKKFMMKTGSVLIFQFAGNRLS